MRIFSGREFFHHAREHRRHRDSMDHVVALYPHGSVVISGDVLRTEVRRGSAATARTETKGKDTFGGALSPNFHCSMSSASGLRPPRGAGGVGFCSVRGRDQAAASSMARFTVKSHQQALHNTKGRNRRWNTAAMSEPESSAADEDHDAEADENDGERGCPPSVRALPRSGGGWRRTLPGPPGPQRTRGR